VKKYQGLEVPLPSVCLAILVFFLSGSAEGGTSGVVLDPAGAVVAGAEVSVRSVTGTPLAAARSGADGTYHLPELPAGSHILRIEARGFAVREVPLTVDQEGAGPLEVRLDLASTAAAVTVTATLGSAEEPAGAVQMVTVRTREELQAQPAATIGNGLERQPGMLVQQTTYGQVSPILRGLTGYETLFLVDGIRYNTSIFRSGPNQYLAWLDPSQASALEAMLGPSSTQYGSDSLGGTINVLGPPARFGSERTWQTHGEMQAFAASADMSAGADYLGSTGNNRWSWVYGAYGRKLNDLRSGGGEDSHNAFLRFLGLTRGQVRDLLGTRLQDSGFSQYGFDNRFSWRPSMNQGLTLRYLFSQQDDVRSYRDRIGGVGRLQALVEPQQLNFAYARYEKLRVGWFDSLSGTFSVNRMADGYVRQNLNFTDPVQRDDSSVFSSGYAVQGLARAGRRHALAMGGDWYRERIGSWRFTTQPTTAVVTQDRALYPNGSHYDMAGLYVQDMIEVIPQRLRATLGGRWTQVTYQTRAAENISDAGKPLGVVDSRQDYSYFSFNGSVLYRLSESWSLQGLVSRGIRAPNVTDLSSIGVTTLGFDVTSIDAAQAGALVGTDGSESALATGRRYQTLQAEVLNNFELGIRRESRRWYWRAQAFAAEISDPLVGRTLVFPAGQVPQQIAGYPVTVIAPTAAQQAQGVVTVATALSSRAVRSMANEGKLRYAGIESLLSLHLNSRWLAEANYAYLGGRELSPNRPVRRLPPQQASFALHYAPAGRWWVEGYTVFSGSQYRMNAQDYDDDRMGASRRRSDMADFFRGGYAMGYVSVGPDGKRGTADAVFTPTGETLLQIQDRVLPLGQVVNGVLVVNSATRVPLYVGSPSWWMFGARAGLPLGERLTAYVSLANLADRNYRMHGSGTDAPGFNATISLRYVF
jgi:hemoglobin/transferrin/lactoferrin receptor protein